MMKIVNVAAAAKLRILYLEVVLTQVASLARNSVSLFLGLFEFGRLEMTVGMTAVFTAWLGPELTIPNQPDPSRPG